MIKISAQTKSGIPFIEEFDSFQDFIAVQLADFPLMADNDTIISIEKDGEPYDFTGNAGELYYHLMEQK